MWFKIFILIILTFATELISSDKVEEDNGAPNPFFVIGSTGSQQIYHFGYDTKVKGAPRLMREETRLADGTVVGRYGYTDPFGVFRMVQYVAGLNGYYATEDIGGSSPSTPQYFKATARQVHEVSEEPKSYSHHLATKFNPPLYHPEAHMAETPAAENVEKDKEEEKEGKEVKEVIVDRHEVSGVDDKPRNSRQELNFNYPKIRSQSIFNPSVDNNSAQNKKHRVFSLSDSESILERNFNNQKPYSSVSTGTQSQYSVPIVKQNIDKRIGFAEVENKQNNNDNNEKLFSRISNDNNYTNIDKNSREYFSNTPQNVRNNQNFDSIDRQKTHSFRVFSLNDSEVILEGKHKNHSNVNKESRTQNSVEPNLDKIFGFIQRVKEQNFEGNEDKPFSRVITDNNYTNIEEILRENSSKDEENNKNITNTEINDENVTRSTYEEIFDIFSPEKDVITQKPNYADFVTVTNTQSTHSTTTESSVSSTTEALPESLKHLYYNPTRSPIISYTSFVTSVSKESSHSSELPIDEQKIRNDSQTDARTQSNFDFWTHITDSLHWPFGQNNETKSDANENKTNLLATHPEYKETESVRITEVMTESVFPVFTNRDQTSFPERITPEVPEVPEIERISRVKDNFETEYVRPIIDHEIEGKSISNSTEKISILYNTYRAENINDTESITVPNEENYYNFNLNLNNPKEDLFMTTEQTITTADSSKEITTSATHHIKSELNTETEGTLTTKSDEFLTVTEILRENKTEINLEDKEFLTKFPFIEDFWNTFNDNATNIVNVLENKTLTEINTSLQSENSFIENTSTETYEKSFESSSLTRDSTQPSIEKNSSEEQTTYSTTSSTTTSTNNPSILSAAQPLTQNFEPKRYIPTLSTFFGFPQLRKRVRKVQKIRFRQNLNNENDTNLTVTEETTTALPNPSDGDILQSESDERVEFRTSNRRDSTRVTRSGFDDDSTRLKSTATERVYHYIPPYQVIKHTFVKKNTYGRADELERIPSVMNENSNDKFLMTDIVQQQHNQFATPINTENNTFSQLANNTNNNNKYLNLERASTERIINKTTFNDSDNSTPTNSSPSLLSSQQSTDRLMRLFERVRPKYLFPLEPKFEPVSEVESSKFIPFEQNLSKINYEPPIRELNPFIDRL